jgi:O-antigen ligase
MSWLCFLPLIIVGSVFYEERLNFTIVSLNTVLFLLSLSLFAISIYGTKRHVFLNNYILFFIFFFLAFSPMVFIASGANFEGVSKYINSILIGLLGACILTVAIQNRKEDKVFTYLFLFMFVLFIAAIIWKLKFGFWRRDVPYFLNGPIVFGRNMAVGFIAVMLFPPKSRIIKYTLLILFSFGVVWSMSKGPILSLLLCVSFYLFLKSKFYFTVFFGSMLFVFILLLTGGIDLSGGSLNRLQMGMQALFGLSDSVNNAGSINIRQEMFVSTLDVIKNQFFTGIGAGLWGEYLNYNFTYPHNFFLEVFSELGIFFGFVFIAPYVLFVVSFRNFFYIFPLFFLLAQQMSGDVADARWLLMFSLIVLFSLNTSRRQHA